MSLNDVTSTAPIGRTGQAGAAGDTDRAKVRQLAEQFESMLLAQMLKEMKRAMTPEADEPGLGGPIIGDQLSTELALALARSDRLLGLPIGLKRFRDQMGPWRYAVFVMLLLGMVALPIKMILRWTINLKYIVAMPEIFFNI